MHASHWHDALTNKRMHTYRTVSVDAYAYACSGRNWKHRISMKDTTGGKAAEAIFDARSEPVPQTATYKKAIRYIAIQEPNEVPITARVHLKCAKLGRCFALMPNSDENTRRLNATARVTKYMTDTEENVDKQKFETEIVEASMYAKPDKIHSKTRKV